ncbi:MAG: nucleotidyltransferase domain-containing protein [Thermodesulfobacteria bacterium]|nr:nucleotidyltransferase domain-containing protein [Thermodesulfobacteriota bacterium]
MRLSKEEITVIKKLALEIFGKDARVWIFGSRVDPNLKGGDIDIYIEVSDAEDLLEKKLDYLVKLKDTIGEQKIDLVVKPKGCQEFICKEAKQKGIEI